MTDSDIGKAKGIVTLIAALVVVGMIVALVGYVAFAGTVDEGDRTVLKTHGEITDTLEPGLHWGIVPIYHSTEAIEIRPQTYTMTGDVHEGDLDSQDAVDFYSADNQQVGVDITVRYTVDSDRVDDYHREYNNHHTFEQRLLRPTTIHVVAERGSSFDATEAHSDEGRAALRSEVVSELNAQAPDYINIQSVQIRAVHLDAEYVDALEDVQRAEERAQAARVEAQGKADAEVTRAEGDAEAMEIRTAEITEQILALEQIQAYDDGTVFVVDPNSNTIMQMNPDEAEEEWGDD